MPIVLLTNYSNILLIAGLPLFFALKKRNLGASSTFMLRRHANISQLYCKYLKLSMTHEYGKKCYEAAIDNNGKPVSLNKLFVLATVSNGLYSARRAMNLLMTINASKKEDLHTSHFFFIIFL